MSFQPTGGFKEKSEVITSKDEKKTNKRKSQSMELHVRNSNDLKKV